MLVNNKELLKYYNEYFAWLPDYEVVNPFVIKDVENEENANKPILFVGKISSKLAKYLLEIDVKIPLGFPNEKISLTTTSLRNYAHLIPNKDKSSWFCLNTPFCETIEDQLDLEIERLSGWIDKYLNKGEEHESAPNSYRSSAFQLFYSEDKIKEGESVRLTDICWGETECYCQGNKYYPTNLGNNSIEWNDTFKDETLFEKTKIYWFFTNKTPALEDRSLLDNLFELNEFVTISNELDDICKEKYGISLKKSKIQDSPEIQTVSLEEAEAPLGELTFQEEYFEEQYLAQQMEEEYFEEQYLAQQMEEEYLEFTQQMEEQYLAQQMGEEGVLMIVGFKFENEIRWEFAKILLHTTRTIDNKEYNVLVWMKTTNISYENYFGRGRLCDKIVNSKIAIIGIGAIGSQLAETLVRGGIKDLYIIDNDIIEHGNICRSSYSFLDVGINKTTSLARELFLISPYVNVEETKMNIYSEINYHSKKDISDFLNQVDIIFDCTASNELLHCLSTLDLKKQIISFGITNEARDMICVTNSKDNLFEQRKFFLKQLEHETENLYYEGIGCYTPTFRANFADINSLLNLAVKHIDKSFSEKGTADSFVLSHADNGIVKDNIVTYSQKELGFTLSISQHCLDEIEHYSYMHYPLEFGGYLLGGYSKDMKRIYLTNILIAENKINGRAFFQPIDNSAVHKKITEIFDKTQGLINYIGEWHTHPEMDNFYSGTDFDSIKKQAKSKNIFTNNPLLCVVSVGKRNFEPKFYIYYNNDLYAFVK